jgi:sugar lactone lactonase YvrE
MRSLPGWFLLLLVSVVPAAGAAFGQLPLAFEPNQGQYPPEVRFAVRHGSATTFLMDTEAAVTLVARRGAKQPQVTVKLKFSGAARPSEIEGIDRQPGVSNYYLGSDPNQWITGVPQYSSVRLRDVYPGTDVVFHGASRRLEYDFVLAPGADPSRIEVELEGADRVDVSPEGELVLATAAGPLRWRVPEAYQESGGARRRVRAAYHLKGGARFGFQLDAYDRSRGLVIDPQIVYSSTFFGGEMRAVAVDAAGNATVAGIVQSPDFPLVPPQTYPASQKSATLVAKVNAAGTALVYSTFIGSGDTGNGFAAMADGAYAVALDTAGNAYVTGGACTSAYPAVSPTKPWQAKRTGGCDAYVAKLDGAKGTIVYGTYLGGTGADQGRGIAVDAQGVATVVGETSSTDFPIQKPFQSKLAGMSDVFITRLSADGSTLLSSTYLGGSAAEAARGIALDPQGNIYITGHTRSLDFPTKNGYRSQRTGDPRVNSTDLFISKLNPAADTLLYSTYLGGSINEVSGGLAVDAAGNVYLTGSTWSPDYPIFPYDPAFQPSPSNCAIFVTKLAPSANNIEFSTHLGGSYCDHPGGIALDRSGRIYVSGLVYSPDFPTVNAIQSARSVDTDAFLAEFEMPGPRLVFSTLLGGNGSETERLSWILGDYLAPALAIDSSGDVYVVGETDGTGFPVKNPMYTWNVDDFRGAFITKITGLGLLCTDVVLGGDPLPDVVPAAGWTFSLTLRAFPTGCNWGAATDSAWLKLSGTVAGSGEGSLTLQVSANTRADDRTGTLVVAGKSISITQAGMELPGSVEMAAGSPPSGVAGQALAPPLAVRVLTSGGNPAAKVPVVFQVTGGTAWPMTATVASGADGVASFAATLGFTPGVVTVTASVQGLEPVVFKVQVTAPEGGAPLLVARTAAGTLGDGGTASEAVLSKPLGLAWDSYAGLYMADSGNQLVRLIGPDIKVRSVAGQGRVPPGASPVNAGASRLVAPAAVATDGIGGLYVTHGNQISRLAGDGTISVVAGTAAAGYAGDGGPAASAQFRNPGGIAADADGNIWIADTGNHRVREISPDGTVRTVAGSGKQGYAGDGGLATQAQIDSPVAVLRDAYGNTYIAEGHNIRLVTYDGKIRTLAGTGSAGFSGDLGPAAAARLNHPRGMALDGPGNLYFCDGDNHRVRRVSTGGMISTVAGTGIAGYSGDGGAATQATLTQPWGLASDPGGSLFVSEGDRIRMVLSDGRIATLAGGSLGGDAVPATAAILRSPMGVAAGPAGDVYVADAGTHRVRKMDGGGALATIAGTGVSGFSGDGGAATDARLNAPQTAALGPDGKVYIADTGNNCLRVVDLNGVITTLGGTLAAPSGVWVAPDGTIYVAERGGHAIRSIAPDGSINTVAGGNGQGLGGDDGPATAAQLNAPTALTMDAAGNLLFADTGNQRVRKIDAGGIITTIAGDAASALSRPAGLAVDASGTVYVSDTGSNRVRKIDSTGAMSVVAGTGDVGSYGDGEAALDAAFSGPAGLAIDAAGRLLIADPANHKVRVIAP